jgi:hypothetical protein
MFIQPDSMVPSAGSISSRSAPSAHFFVIHSVIQAFSSKIELPVPGKK